MQRRILLFPVASLQDIIDNPQLEARDYIQDITHPELGDTLTFLGPFIQSSAAPLHYRRFPPKIGEHNAEIYRDELGLQQQELVRLREVGVI